MMLHPHNGMTFIEVEQFQNIINLKLESQMDQLKQVLSNVLDPSLVDLITKAMNSYKPTDATDVPVASSDSNSVHSIEIDDPDLMAELDQLQKTTKRPRLHAKLAVDDNGVPVEPSRNVVGNASVRAKSAPASLGSVVRQRVARIERSLPARTPTASVAKVAKKMTKSQRRALRKAEVQLQDEEDETNSSPDNF